MVFNGGFETGDFSDWFTIGNTSIQTNSIGISPIEGTFQALLSTGIDPLTGSSPVLDFNLERFFGFPRFFLDIIGGGDAIEGSGIVQFFTANAGDLLLFNTNFLSNEPNPSPSSNDFAFYFLTPVVPILANTFSTFADPIISGYTQQSGYDGYTIAFATPGLYALGFGVVDLTDGDFDSALLVDNVRLFTGFLPFDSDSSTNLDADLLAV